MYKTANSLSFSSDLVRGLHARAIVERRSGETRETRAASPVSRIQSRAWSFACLRRFARRTKKKERLLVVYTCTVGCVLFIINFEHYFLQGSLVLNKTLMKKYCKLVSLLSVLVLVTECKVCNWKSWHSIFVTSLLILLQSNKLSYKNWA